MKSENLLYHEGHLFVRLGVHEVESHVIAVQVLEFAPVDLGVLHVLAGTEGPLYQRTGVQVLELHLHERFALAGFGVGVLDHLEEAVGQVERHPGAYIIR